jgi:hypothetical protein
MKKDSLSKLQATNIRKASDNTKDANHLFTEYQIDSAVHSYISTFTLDNGELPSHNTVANYLNAFLWEKLEYATTSHKDKAGLEILQRYFYDAKLRQAVLSHVLTQSLHLLLTLSNENSGTLQ